MSHLNVACFPLFPLIFHGRKTVVGVVFLYVSLIGVVRDVESFLSDLIESG